jgi:hypothetical protein
MFAGLYRCVSIRFFKPSKERYSRKASDVVAKPPGTMTPDPDRLEIISPNEAFLHQPVQHHSYSVDQN